MNIQKLDEYIGRNLDKLEAFKETADVNEKVERRIIHELAEVVKRYDRPERSANTLFVEAMESILVAADDLENELAIAEMTSDNIMNQLIVSKKEIAFDRDIEGYIEESEANQYYQEVMEKAQGGVVGAIQSVIESIQKFLRDVMSKFSGTHDKKAKDALKTAEKECTPEQMNEKVKIVLTDKKIKLLDEYIREVLKLERELMNLNVVNAGQPKKLQNGRYVVEYEKIQKKLDALNEKYDKEMLKKSEKIVEMARKDAIRYNEKQLNEVKLDMDAISKGSTKVLVQFKKDAAGNEVPVEKTRLIHKMSSSIGTRVRKSAYKQTELKLQNLKSILLGTAFVGLLTFSMTPSGRATIANSKENIKQKINEEVQAAQQ